MGSGAPEDGSDGFGGSLVVGGRLPGQRLLRVLKPHSELLEDVDGRNFAVQSVEVKAINDSAVEKLPESGGWRENKMSFLLRITSLR